MVLHSGNLKLENHQYILLFQKTILTLSPKEGPHLQTSSLSAGLAPAAPFSGLHAVEKALAAAAVGHVFDYTSAGCPLRLLTPEPRVNPGDMTVASIC